MTDTIKDDLLRRAYVLLLCALPKSGVMTIGMTVGEVEGQEWLCNYEEATRRERLVEFSRKENALIDELEEEEMTIIYCDLCGKALDKGDSGCRVAISEYKADSCDNCAKRLINYVKTGPWKSSAKP